MGFLKRRDPEENLIEECLKKHDLSPLWDTAEVVKTHTPQRNKEWEVRKFLDALLERWLFRITLIQMSFGLGVYALLLLLTLKWGFELRIEPYNASSIFLLPPSFLIISAVLMYKQRLIKRVLSRRRPQAMKDLSNLMFFPLFMNILFFTHFISLLPATFSFAYEYECILFSTKTPLTLAYASSFNVLIMGDAPTISCGIIMFMWIIYALWVLMLIAVVENHLQDLKMTEVFSYSDLLGTVLAASFLLVPFTMSFLGGGLGWFISLSTRFTTLMLLGALGGLLLIVKAGVAVCGHPAGSGAPSPVKNSEWTTPALTVTSFAIIALLLSYPLSIAITPTYEKVIERIYTSEDEKYAIEVAESLNYSEYFNLTPFFYWGHEGYNPPSYHGYVWINIINRTTIDFYSEKIDVLKRERVKTRAHFHYRAEAKEFSNALFRYFNGTIQVEVEGEAEEIVKIYAAYISVGNFTYPDENATDSYRWALWAPIQVNLSLERAFLVTMDLSYGEYYAPLAAFGNSFSQVVILDDDFNPVAIFVERAGHWIS